jgi:hypothetical protein
VAGPDQLSAPPSIGEPLARLEQPRVTEALNVLLENADVLAVPAFARNGPAGRGGSTGGPSGFFSLLRSPGGEEASRGPSFTVL